MHISFNRTYEREISEVKSAAAVGKITQSTKCHELLVKQEQIKPAHEVGQHLNFKQGKQFPNQRKIRLLDIVEEMTFKCHLISCYRELTLQKVWM